MEESEDEQFEDDDIDEINDELDDFGFSDDDSSDKEKEKITKKKEPSIYLRAEDFVINGGSKSATERLLRDLTNLKKLDVKTTGFEASPIEDNLYKWEVKLFFDNDSQIGKDLEEFSKLHGQVTTGGSICMELLTPSGWTADIEFVLVQIRATMISGDGKLGKDADKEYTETEALESFARVAKSHGWLK